MSNPLRIGILLFPRLTQLDAAGPYEVFARLPGAETFLVAEHRDPVRSEHGLAIVPTATIDDAPPLDIVCVPGGTGIADVIENDRMLDYVAREGARARFVTSVCTGALVLGAAGLLRGYRATTHWLSLDLLREFRAEPQRARVVVDRNRITGGGVTAGIDFGLTIAAMLGGEDAAREIQLMLEYAPSPPFDSGTPERAARELVERVRARRAEIQSRRAERIRAALARRR